MAGYILLTNLHPEDADGMVRKAARRLDFDVDEIEPGEFQLTKGNFLLSLLLGAFIAYCKFQGTICRKGDDTEITLTRNSPWWTGAIGVSRVKSRAKELADEFEESLHDLRAEVLH